MLSNALFCCRSLVQPPAQCGITSKLDQVGLFQLSSSNLQGQLSHSHAGSLFEFLTTLISVVWAHRKRPPGESITRTGQPSARALPEEDRSGETGCRSRELERLPGPLGLRRPVSGKHVQLSKVPSGQPPNAAAPWLWDALLGVLLSRQGCGAGLTALSITAPVQPQICSCSTECGQVKGNSCINME